MIRETRYTFRPTITGLVRKLRGRLPQSREVWHVSIGWHISAVFLFLALWVFQDFPELSFLALFVSIYVHVVVNRRLAERKLKAHYESETIRRRRELEAVRQDLTTHLDTTTQAVRQDLRRGDRAISEESHIVSSGISYLFQQIQPTTPIWFSRSWAGSPELLATIYDLIIRKKPRFVLDLGSGLTTLVAGYAVRKNGVGQVVAWEHLKKYSQATEDLVSSHGLGNWVSVVLSPLQETMIQGERHLWFKDRPHGDDLIDFIIVDSPPGSLGKESRFPAVPILKSHLADQWTIVLDDTNRVDEQSIEKKWRLLLGETQIEKHGVGTKSHFSVLTPLDRTTLGGGSKSS